MEAKKEQISSLPKSVFQGMKITQQTWGKKKTPRKDTKHHLTLKLRTQRASFCPYVMFITVI